MASIQKRPTRRNGRDAVSYDVRYRDPDGKQRRQCFARKADADRFMATVQADIARGTWIDPSAGRVTLREYAQDWLAAQTFNVSTREATELRLRLHVFPALGDTPLSALRPSQIQAWVRGLEQTLAPQYVRVIAANLSAVLTAAVDDERIGKNPCRAASVKLPRVAADKLVIWDASQVLAVHAALPERHRLMATLAAGCGLRQGEVFGLAQSDVDFLRNVVHVRRQVKIVGGKQVYALPKTEKVRDVPLPESVKLELAAHLGRYPAVDVVLPWEEPTGKPVAAALVLSTRERTALHRNYVNPHVWKPALVAAGVEPTRENMMHALRHFYASTLLDAGESVRALADYLGHADPGFTLRVYTHLMPTSEQRTRSAVDRALAGAKSPVDGTSCANAVPTGAV